MKTVPDYQIRELLPASSGLRRLDVKNERCFSDASRLLPPPPQQISPNGATKNALNKWNCVEDSSGVIYYWSPVDKKYIGSQNRSDELSPAKKNVVYTLPNKVHANHQKVVPSGYSPNKFPLSFYSGSVTITDSIPPSSSNFLANTVPNGQKPFVKSTTSQTTNIVSGQPKAVVDTLHSGYYGVVAPYLQNFKGDAADGCYENVINGKLASLRLQNYESHLKNGSYLPSASRNTNFVSSGSGVIGYPSPSAGDKKLGSFGHKSSLKSELQPSFRSIPVKIQPENDNKAGSGLQNGTSKSCLSRDKPRVPKFFQSLCCCIRSGTAETVKRKPVKPHPLPPTAPHSLITQVKKEFSNGLDAGVETTLSPEQGVYTAEDVNEVDSMVPQCSDKLPLLPPSTSNKKCLIIDLDETLVHSSFKPVENPDFVIPVEIDNVTHQVYVLKRPFVDEFLEKIADKFECVLFTASLAKYADPVADLLDKRRVFKARLFRESCVFHKGNYVKDLTRLGRDLRKIIIVDNSPASYAFHPDNAIAVPSWFDDVNDSELLSIIPLLEQLAEVESIYSVLRNSNEDLRRCSMLGSTNDANRFA